MKYIYSSSIVFNPFQRSPNLMVDQHIRYYENQEAKLSFQFIFLDYQIPQVHNSSLEYLFNFSELDWMDVSCLTKLFDLLLNQFHHHGSLE